MIPNSAGIPAFITRVTEHRVCSIYSRFAAPQNSREMSEMFSDSELPLSLKFSAVLATYARFEFPLQFSDFRSLIPDSVWKEHFRFRRISLRTGFWPIFCGENEWDYELRIGPESRYGPHMVYIVTNSHLDPFTDSFAPPLDSSVVRFTLGHPLLQPELHDPRGIYLFKYA
jgi:hypothetical protein